MRPSQRRRMLPRCKHFRSKANKAPEKYIHPDISLDNKCYPARGAPTYLDSPKRLGRAWYVGVSYSPHLMDESPRRSASYVLTGKYHQIDDGYCRWYGCAEYAAESARRTLTNMQWRLSWRALFQGSNMFSRWLGSVYVSHEVCR